MKYNMIAIVSLFIIDVLCLAAESGQGFYGGVGFGISAFEDDGFVKEEQPQVKGSLSKNDKGVKLYLGYQINKILSAELGYTNYGRFKTENYIHEAQSADIAINVGYTFLEGTLRPYVFGGLGYVFNDFPHSDIASLKMDRFSSHVGIGLDYTPLFAGGFGLRLAFESDGYTYRVDQNGSNEPKDYEQGLGLLYLGMHYKY